MAAVPNLTNQHRFLLSPDGMRAAWVHPLDPQTLYVGWTDATDLNDVEYLDLVVSRQNATEA